MVEREDGASLGGICRESVEGLIGWNRDIFVLECRDFYFFIQELASVFRPAKSAKPFRVNLNY